MISGGKRYTFDELDINFYMECAKSHVGEVNNLDFQAFGRRGEPAGQYEILEFIPAEAPAFTYTYKRFEDDQTPDGADLGFYMVRIFNTKFYNGKTFRVPVTAYVQDKGHITKALHVSSVNADTGKALKAYEFPIIDWRVYA